MKIAPEWRKTLTNFALSAKKKTLNVAPLTTVYSSASSAQNITEAMESKSALLGALNWMR